MRRDDALLLDMLLAARDAVNFAHGLTFEAFAQNRIAQLAILRAVETVGRASSRAGADTNEAHPEISWADIVEMRHCFMDENFNIDLTQLWETAERDIHRLIPHLERLVPPETEA